MDLLVLFSCNFIPVQCAILGKGHSGITPNEREKIKDVRHIDEISKQNNLSLFEPN